MQERTDWQPPTDWVAQVLRRRILSSLYRVGEAIPGERQLTEEFGVARGTVRAALQRLEHEQLIARGHGKKTRVTAPSDRLRGKPVGIVHAFPAALNATGPESALLLQGIRHRLGALGYHAEALPFLEAKRDLYGADRAGALTVDEVARLPAHYAALIFVDAQYPLYDAMVQFEADRFPFVVANMEMEWPFTATWVDHAATTRRAVELLAAMGHRRIAFLGRAGNLYFYDHAVGAFRAALHAAGIACDDSLVGLMDEDCAVESYRRTQDWLRTADPPTAIVLARDYLAAGVCKAVRDAGLEIGYDVSVIGFDDLSGPHEQAFLTTFREPCVEMGQEAAQLLAQRLVLGWQPPERREIPAELVMRRSVGLPPRRT